MDCGSYNYFHDRSGIEMWNQNYFKIKMLELGTYSLDEKNIYRLLLDRRRHQIDYLMLAKCWVNRPVVILASNFSLTSRSGDIVPWSQVADSQILGFRHFQGRVLPSECTFRIIFHALDIIFSESDINVERRYLTFIPSSLSACSCFQYCIFTGSYYMKVNFDQHII